MNLAGRKFTVGSGRCILVDGMPFVTLSACRKPEREGGGYALDTAHPPADADTFTHQIVALIECWQADRARLLVEDGEA